MLVNINKSMINAPDILNDAPVGNHCINISFNLTFTLQFILVSFYYFCHFNAHISSKESLSIYIWSGIRKKSFSDEHACK